MGLSSAEQIVHLTDNYITEVSQRELVSAQEVIDLLLDIRTLATGDMNEDGNTTTTPED